MGGDDNDGANQSPVVQRLLDNGLDAGRQMRVRNTRAQCRDVGRQDGFLSSMYLPVTIEGPSLKKK